MLRAAGLDVAAQEDAARRACQSDGGRPRPDAHRSSRHGRRRWHRLRGAPSAHHNLQPMMLIQPQQPKPSSHPSLSLLIAYFAIDASISSVNPVISGEGVC